MGYFDYLETKSATELKDNAFIETYNKVALYVNLGAVAMSIVTIIMFCFVPVGSIVWLDVVVAIGLTAGIVSMVYANSVRSIAKRRHKKNVLANFVLVWSLFWVLINTTIFIINTWIYFA